MRNSFPQHRVLGGPSADRSDLARDKSMRGDNTAAWEERCKPVVEFLIDGGKTLTEIRAWGRAYRIPGTDGCSFGANLAEECVYYLERHRRLARGDDRVWRLV